MITVMTTVYNRAYIISQLYESLLRQTCRNFEWLIVDDGSTDNLKELCHKWIEDSARKFEIQYVYRENGGKHRAWNTGLSYAKGRYLFPVDSDDYLTDDALSKAELWLKQIKNNKKLAGVSGNRGRFRNGKIELIGKYPVKKKFVDANNFQRFYKRLEGDKAEIYRTEILRKYPFPEFDGEKFCTEEAVFGRIARAGYKLRWFPDIIMITEYLNDGLTNNIVKNKKNYFQAYTYAVKNSTKYYPYPFNFLHMGEYAYFASIQKISEKEGARLIGISVIKYKISKIVFLINRFRKRFIQARG